VAGGVGGGLPALTDEAAYDVGRFTSTAQLQPSFTPGALYADASPAESPATTLVPSRQVIYIYIYIYICVFICIVYIDVHTYIYMYICIDACIYIYI